MTARQVAWTASVFLVLAVTVSAVIIWFLLWEQENDKQGILQRELLYSTTEIMALERIDNGNLEAARELMIQRVFNGVTFIYPDRSELSSHDQNRLQDLIRRFSEFRDLNPNYFAGQEDWWLERFDSWSNNSVEN